MYIKIGDTLYPAEIDGRIKDAAWGGRESKAVTLAMSHADAAALFADGIEWSIVSELRNVPITDAEGNPVFDGEGKPTFTQVRDEYDNSDFCVAGSITDNRDGTVTVKMGKPTEAETKQTDIDTLAAALAELGVNVDA